MFNNNSEATNETTPLKISKFWKKRFCRSTTTTTREHNSSLSPHQQNSDVRIMDSNRRTLVKIGLDVTILCCVGFPILFFFLFGEPYQRGFFCDDESIRHPFHDSTVRSWMLYIYGIVLPITIIVITEMTLASIRGNGSSGYTLFNRDIPLWMANCYKHIGFFGFGAACSQLATDIGKYSIGRFRPHFYSVCMPRMLDGTTCENATNHNRYIENFTCDNAESTARMLKEMRLSFPSGHSSFSAYTMIFCAIYLQARMSWRGSQLLRHFLQFLLIMLAWYTALSRISDYKHHWSDVLAGATLGALVAVITANYVSDMLRENRKTQSMLPQTRYELGTPNNHITTNGSS